MPAYLAIVLAGEIARAASSFADNPDDLACFWGGFFFGLGGAAMVAGTFLIGPAMALLIGALGWMILGLFIPTNTALQCKALVTVALIHRPPESIKKGQGINTRL